MFRVNFRDIINSCCLFHSRMSRSFYYAAIQFACLMASNYTGVFNGSISEQRKKKIAYEETRKTKERTPMFVPSAIFKYSTVALGIVFRIKKILWDIKLLKYVGTTVAQFFFSTRVFLRLFTQTINKIQ